MRNLTIKRTKSIVAGLIKMKVYIADPLSGDTVIDGVNCRKLGDLKNGEEKTFQIDNTEAQLYVIADKLSKNYCNDFVRIPEGELDVYLEGKNRYNPFTGNPFRFEGFADEEVEEKRKKSQKKAIVICCIAFVVGLALGILKNLPIFTSNIEKTFSYEEMTVTLTEEFREVSLDEYDAHFGSSKVGVFVLKEEFSDFGGQEFSLTQYGNLLLKANDFDSSVKLQRDGELTYFEFEADDGTLKYFCVIFKSTDAFWFFQFAAETEDYEEQRPNFIEWAKTITFSDQQE